jgi:hypothetical protein
MLPPALESMAEEARKRLRAALLTDEDATRFPSLLAVEEALVAFTTEMGRGLLEVFVGVREQQAKAMRGRCSCGARLELHRRTTWTRQSPFGPVRVGDPYAYCRRCHSSCRPLHAWLGTDRETWSLLVEEAAVDLASDESAGKAVAKLARHHPGVEMDRTAALRMLHAHGKQARQFIDEKLAAAANSAELTSVERGEGAAELEVEFDAGMVPVATLEPIPVPEDQLPELTPVRGLPKRRKNARWEEVKAGLVQTPGKIDRLYSLRPTGGLEAAFADLFALACMEGWTETTEVRGIADGAVHIRQRMEENFGAGDFRFILDRPHAKEHLSDAGQALETMTGTPAQTWATDAMTKLEAGQADAVVMELEAAHLASGADEDDRDDQLRLEAGYFRRNADAVAYAQYRAAGWSTASSEIESAHRHIVQSRLKIAGAWWDPHHVDDILALRMLKANGWWDEYWAGRRRDWRTRAETLAEARHSNAA